MEINNIYSSNCKIYLLIIREYRNIRKKNHVKIQLNSEQTTMLCFLMKFSCTSNLLSTSIMNTTVVIAGTQWTCESRCSTMVMSHVLKSRCLITFVGAPMPHVVRIYTEN